MVLWEVFGCSSRENIAGMTADWVRTWRGWEVVRNTVICYWQCCSYERDSAVGFRRVFRRFFSACPDVCLRVRRLSVCLSGVCQSVAGVPLK